MSKKTRRVFDKEFKIEAVRLATVGDRTVSERAESLDIHVSLLTKWIRASREEGSDAGKRCARGVLFPIEDLGERIRGLGVPKLFSGVGALNCCK